LVVSWGVCEGLGPFTRKATGPNRGCERPFILTGPSQTAVRHGETATFAVAAIGTPPITYSWLDLGQQIAVGAGTLFTTPPLSSDASYAVTATNACGSDTNSPFVVSVKPVRHRGVRR